jgi:hypothetical protein
MGLANSTMLDKWAEFWQTDWAGLDWARPCKAGLAVLGLAGLGCAGLSKTMLG